MFLSKTDPLRPALTATSKLGCLFALVLLSRLPFLDAGYGLNIDAWRVARAAREIATTGEYSVSRFPGYPLQEITCALFWRGGPCALNALTAIFSAVAATAFAVIVRRLGCRDWFLAGLALAATPIFFVSSVCSKDYMWGLAFVLLSLLSALNYRPAVAGALLGLAIGCRPTSAAMALPIALVVADGPPHGWRSIAKFAAAASIIALLAFMPAFFRYGIGFLTFYANHPRPTGSLILIRSTFEVWGGFGLIALGIAAGGAWLARKQPHSNNPRIVWSILLILAIYITAYLRLPDQAGYLLPIVPAALLLVCLFSPRPILQIAFFSLLFAPVAEPTPRGIRPGAILADHQDRLQNLANIRDLLQLTESASGNNTFVVGASEPEIAVLTPRLRDGRNRYVYLMTALEARAAIGDGRHLYYLPAMRKFNYEATGVDLAEYGALDLRCLLANSNCPPTLDSTLEVSK